MTTKLENSLNIIVKIIKMKTNIRLHEPIRARIKGNQAGDGSMIDKK